MSAGGPSLRWLIDKWFGPVSGNTYRLTRTSRSKSSTPRCVCFESVGPGGVLRIFFFRHGDGSWSVSPPEAERPTFSFD